MKNTFLFAAFIAFCSQQFLVNGDGVIEIELIELKNEKHLDHGQECCDTWPWGRCLGRCDTSLNMCITVFSDTRNRVSCNLADFNTRTFSGMSSIRFGKDLGNGLSNPVKVPFKKPWKFLDLLFTTYDIDTWPNPKDLIDVFSEILLTKPGSSPANATIHHSEIKGRVGTIKFSMKVYCLDGYSGIDCSTTQN